MENERVSVSAANLIVGFRGHSGAYQHIAAQCPETPDLLRPLSAGPAIHHMALSYLEKLGVDISELKEKTSDAYNVRHFDGRVKGLLSENYAEYVRWLCHGASGENSLCDWRVLPELIERLTKPYWQGIHPPLTRDDVGHILLEAGGLIRQPGDASGQGGQRHKVRIFRACKLHMPDEVLQKLLDCAAFATLSHGDITTTKGGKQEGFFSWNGKKMRLANNVGVNQHSLGLFTLQ